jgi:Flp pilus assembly CpaE family ATPase
MEPDCDSETQQGVCRGTQGTTGLRRLPFPAAIGRSMLSVTCSAIRASDDFVECAYRYAIGIAARNRHRFAQAADFRRILDVRDAAHNGTWVATAVERMIVTFLGTKGGTGTTTLAVNGAAEIKRHSARATVIVDTKHGPGDVAVFLGLRPRYGLIDLIDQVGWTDPPLVAHFVAEHPCGLHVLAAAEAFDRPNTRDAEGVDQTLRCLTTLYDFVVVDAGSALTAPAVSALTVSDLVILVANPDVPCLRNLQRLIDALRLAGVASERVRIALNRTSENGALLPAQIERALGRTIEFQMASDYRTVAAAINNGVPVSAIRSCDLQAQVDVLARAIVDATLASAF